jgi:hypothetical protein
MTQVDEIETEAEAPEPVLTAKLSPVWALRLWHLPVIAFWGGFFLLLNFLPLRPTDLWGHVAYGHWIAQHQQLPTEDPFLPLVHGMRVVDSAWLSQLILAAIDRLGGPAWLSNVFAVVTLAAWMIIWRTLYLRSRSMLTSLAMVIVVLFLAWSRVTTPRPENFAWLAFAALWWCLIGDEVRPAGAFRWRLWIGVPLVMGVWANLHGSFVCGLAVLLAYAVGALFTAAWRTRSLGQTLCDGEVQARIFVAELGLVATCFNPYGLDLLLSTFAFGRNANLLDVLEWQPLAIGQAGAYEFVAGWAVATLLLRYSRRPVSLAQGLLLALFGVATLSSNRMIGWFALTFGVSLMPLLDDLLGRLGSAPAPAAATAEPEEVGRGFPLLGRSWNYSLIGLLLLWIPLSLAPITQPLTRSKQRTAAQLFGRETPLKLTAYLRENPPQGQTFNPQWWGDWIIRDGPAGFVPFMTSNIHLAPRQVWLDYLRILRVSPGWQQVLGRYAVETIIVDKIISPDLYRVLQKDPGWRSVYDDPQAAVFVIRKPLPQDRTPPPAKAPAEPSAPATPASNSTP